MPLWIHPDWHDRFPWLVQGTTGRGTEADPFDLGLSGSQPAGEVLERWRRLRAATGAEVIAHSRQVHRADVWVHRGECAPGVLLMDGFDGHVSARPGLVATVSVADCIPVSVIDPEHRATALLHGGWRGVAAGIVERGIQLLSDGWSARPVDLWVHCGPAICGACYEVGPEVHQAIHPGREPPAAPTPIDLRAAVAERVIELGVPPDQVSISLHCTPCGPPDFFSHRGGSPARQMGVLGIRTGT